MSVEANYIWLLASGLSRLETARKSCHVIIKHLIPLVNHKFIFIFKKQINIILFSVNILKF